MKLIIVAVMASAATGATFKINDMAAEKAENKEVPIVPVLPTLRFDEHCAGKAIVYEPSAVCSPGNTSQPADAAARACSVPQRMWLKI